jgi:glycosyltransferase involved in cell wall biosynthesis
MPSLARMPGVTGALVRICVDLSILVPIYFGAVVVLHGSFAPLFRILSLLRDMVPSSQEDGESLIKDPTNIQTVTATPLVQDAGKDLPLVSILIPAYNAEQWIAATLRSALAQTWPRTEVIVIDDGSTDRTAAIAREFEDRGAKVVTQKNQGASAARNKAFFLCHGDYIQWLDADDLLAPDKISKQMELVMEGLDRRILLSSAWAHFMYRPHAAHFLPSPLWCDLSPREWLMTKMRFNVFMQTSTWLVSREITVAAGPWDIRLLGDDDGEYFCRVLLASKGVRFVRDSRVYYRAFRFDGLSYVGRFPEKIEAHWVSMKLHIKHLQSFGDTPEIRSSCLQFLRDSMIYFYPERKYILDEAKSLAAELGEPLGVPHLSWKYLWLEKLVGWGIVKPSQRVLRTIRWRTTKKVDYLLFRIETWFSSISMSPQSDDRAEARPSARATSSATEVSGN